MSDVCEICGQGGEVVGAVVFDSYGNQVQIVVHVVCENSRTARLIRQRGKARYN